MRYVFDVVAPAELLNQNSLPSRYKKAEITKAWRTAGAWRARLAGVPVLVPPVRVVYRVFKTRSSRYDPANYYPTVKAILDGVVDAGVLVDDSFREVVGPDPRHGGVVGSKRDVRIEIVLEELGDEPVESVVG